MAIAPMISSATTMAVFFIAIVARHTFVAAAAIREVLQVTCRTQNNGGYSHGVLGESKQSLVKSVDVGEYWVGK